MINYKIKETIKNTVRFDKEFMNFYNAELKELINGIDDSSLCEKFKISTDKYVYYLDFWPFDEEKNQKQTVFLISKYDLDRTVLFNSFRLDVEMLDNVHISIINWKKEDDDYVTKQREIVLNKNEFKL